MTALGQQPRTKGKTYHYHPLFFQVLIGASIHDCFFFKNFEVSFKCTFLTARTPSTLSSVTVLRSMKAAIK